MEAALGAANWLLGKVLQKLSDDLVAAYVASSELGLNFEQIKTRLNYTHGLLHAAQERDVSNNPGLQGLLEDLSKKADEAEDALDELHYFIIQDQLDGTQEAAPEVAGGLRSHALHGSHAVRHTIGNWLPCFSCSRMQDDDAADTNNPLNTTKTKPDNDNGDHVDKLPFDRVAMSNKIKSLIEGIHSLCAPVSDLLKINHIAGRSASLKRPHTSSVITQDKLYGRDAIFDKTVKDITSDTYHGATLSVLPIVGPGGIGKTTFAQHLYNDKRTEAYFSIRVWVCVSTGFDVLKLTPEILKCILKNENEERIMANDITNLNELQKSIAQKLKSKRFLIVLDDIWTCCSEGKWENLLAPFTKGEAKGNMVLVTTRFPKVAQMVMKATNPINLQGLEPNDFFTFFEACVFGENKPEHYEDDLTKIGRQIAKKLKCSPLAAKTVGRLLKNNLSQEHWVEVLERKEWQNQSNDNDIMPALKISYEYLPFHLKKCFSYCALFPEDYKFDSLEITRFWIALGIIDSSGKNNKIVDIGLKYLEELVDNGFLMKVDGGWSHYHVMHDLFHELAQNVSARECANISCSSFRADDIPPSVHHLSITIQDKYDENFEREMGRLKSRLDIRNLRALMFFGEEIEDIDNILKDTFKEINSLRVLFIFMNSRVSLPHNFSKLIHLQFLKIRSPNTSIFLPSTLSRFYHLKFLDLEGWYGSDDLPKDISRLVNLHHFLADKELHSNVPEVGKMKCLQELKKFCVKKERVGFELRELGKLTELGGELSICNLENVATKGEANDAELMLKRNLKGLTLVWGTKQQTTGSDVLDGLQPHPNLRWLRIVNHGGDIGPSWLCRHICIKMLEVLNLEGVSWGILPPFGQLPHLTKLILKNIAGMHQFGPDFGGVTDNSFVQLKTVGFEDMPELVKWIGGSNCHLFSRLESIHCRNCPNLSALPFSECSGPSTQDINAIWFPNLCSLRIDSCPMLSLPPMPHSSTLTYIRVEECGVLKLSYYEKKLLINGYNGALAFHHLDKVEDMEIQHASHISLTDLQKLNYLRRLKAEGCGSMFSGVLDDGAMLHSVQSLYLESVYPTRKLLSKVFNCLPNLSKLAVHGMWPPKDVLQFPSSSSLRKLELSGGESLILPVEDGGGLRELMSLQSLVIRNCGKLFSRWSMGEAQIIKPLPPSLRELDISGESSMASMALLSNLTSLTCLSLVDCDNLSMDGFNPLITVYLKKLTVFNNNRVRNCQRSIAADLLSEVARMKTAPACLSQLEELEVDSISAVLVSPICSLLSATLHTLGFSYDKRAESFTEEQEHALQLLTSLQHLSFEFCLSLQSLPEGLHCLSSLNRLNVSLCRKIRSLPKGGFPTSLKRLHIFQCSADLEDQAEKLEEKNPDLEVLTH